jgi:nucleoside-diphosphate-sugar epimerase
MAKVLITGAAGFLGRHCLELLVDEQHEVHVVTRSATLSARPNLHIHGVDLFEHAQVHELLRTVRPSHLLHLAWVTAPATYRDSLANLDWLAASVQLLRAFAENGGQRVVMAGSCAEYDWANGVCDETTTPLHPGSLYGICKNALREVLEGCAHCCEISAAWGRIFYLYGPGEHPDRFVSYVTRSLLAGRSARCSTGTQRRDYIYVKDAARAFAMLLFSSVAGPVNIGSGAAVEVATLAQTIGKLTGRPDLVLLGSAQPLSPEVPLVVSGQRRLGGELGWSPEFPLERGLTDTVAWWKQQLDR